MNAQSKAEQSDTGCGSQCVCLELARPDAQEISIAESFNDWNDSTRFSLKGGCAKSSFDSGQTVRVWYRRETGQNVLREVTTKGVFGACGKACK